MNDAQNQTPDFKSTPPRVFLLPPPGLPVPAVKGGAVETLITHLIEENERQGLLRLECASVPHPDAAAAAAGWQNTRMHWIAPPPAALCRLYGPLRGAAHRLGRSGADAWPQDPWYLAAARRIRTSRPDVLVAEGGNLAEAARIRRKTGLGRQNLFAHLHMQTAPTPFLQRQYGGAIGISRFVLERWQPAEGLPCAKHLVYNCVDLGLFAPAPAGEVESRSALRAQLGFAEGDFVTLFCGRICPEKGVHRLLAAMALLPDAFKLLVVGSPFFAAEDSSPFFEQLKRLAAPLTEAGRVRFTGFVHNSRLPQYYRAADAACLPALWDEPAGITAIEAMACGCPVVATDSGGMPEYLAGSGAVLLGRDEVIDDAGAQHPVPGAPPLEEAIAAALRDLARHPARRAEMAEAGVRRAAAFGRENYYRQFCRAVGAG